MTIKIGTQLITMPSGYINRRGSAGVGQGLPTIGYAVMEYSGFVNDITLTGLVYQWGTVSITGGGTVSVTFPLMFDSFVSGILASIFTNGVDTSSDRWSPKLYSLTLSGFSLRNTNDSVGHNINWLAIGR